jgi:hypothetical protein
LFSRLLTGKNNLFTFGFLRDLKGDRLKGAVKESST